MPATRALARSGLSAEGHGVAAPYAIAGTILLAIELILAMPGNGLVDLRRHRIPGTVLSHAAVTLIAIALAPMLPRALARLAALRPATALAWLAVSLTAPIGVIALVTAVAPRYARELFTREWGLVEPAQFVLYLLAARVFWLVRPPAPWTARAMRAGAIVALGLALEEIDYLGLLRHVMPLVEGHRVGGLHDVLNALAGPALLAVLGIAALLALTIATAGVAPGGTPNPGDTPPPPPTPP